MPLRYWVAAQISFLIVLFWAPFGTAELTESFYQGHTLAMAHLLALGWITMTTMGASFQLVPVALETTLYSERLARWQFWFMLLGTVMMALDFWIFRFQG
ncbi:MAG TPA: cytochrome C oxidase subunit I, partial [Candidatus Methylomirabilis sp.]|nr:cytochrome C oxidase subunit I [Candidatus Methylomirabilis sp.]